jgi:iron complex transport system ATP-binding protein
MIPHDPGVAPFSVRWTGVSVTLNERRVLRDVSFEVLPTDFVAVIGPNGAGKSTMLKAIAGIVPLKGAAKAGFRPLPGLTALERARYFSYLSQDRDIAWPMPVRDVVLMGLENASGARSRLDPHDFQTLAEVLWDCGLEHMAERPVNTLSGGERSRVLLARALLSPAHCLLADEPLSALDPAHQLKVMELLATRADGGRPVIAVLHDIAMAARFATKIILLQRGRKLQEGPAEEVLLSPDMENAFGVGFSIYATEEGPAVTISRPRFQTSESLDDDQPNV